MRINYKWQLLVLILVIVLGVIFRNIGWIKKTEAKGVESSQSLNSAIFGAIDMGKVKAYLPKPTQTEKLQKSIDLIGQKVFVLQLIQFYSSKYEVNPNLAFKIANCESGLNPTINNKNSSATGIYQFIKSTFKANCEGVADDPEYNISCAIKMISQGKINHWSASRACWDNNKLTEK